MTSCVAHLHLYFSGKVVARFCAKYLHQQLLANEAYEAGDIGTSLQKAFFRLVKKESSYYLMA